MRVQYAIDTLTRDSALKAADLAVDAGIQCLEAGHVLVKAAGIDIVRTLRARFPDAELIADMKTMDMGCDEVAVAGDAGADLVIVCAAASSGVLLAAREEACARGMGVLVSLMGVQDRVSRARAALAVGLTRVIAHRGIDDDYMWSDPGPRKELGELASLPGIQLALAGGITARSLRAFSDIPLERLIVGRGISEAPDPRREILALLSAAREHPTPPATEAE